MPLFEKTMLPKFSARAQKKSRNLGEERPRQKSPYGAQLLEKQKARFLYGISETQFKKNMRQILESNSKTPKDDVYKKLESRLDNVVYRAGFSTTRTQGRQIVSHRHITVNGKVVNIPSFEVKLKDVVGIRSGSKNKSLFANLKERLKTISFPSWLGVKIESGEAVVNGYPKIAEGAPIFDVESVLDFYRR